MPLDALHLRIATNELSDILCGGRIEKITAVSNDTVAFSIRRVGTVQNLLISTNPSLPACYITAQKPKSEQENLPRFLQNFKRKLAGGRISEIYAPKGERAVYIVIEAKNELGDTCLFTLAAELMGKHSNLILVNGEGKIVECVHFVPADMSSKRQVLPGLLFYPAPAQGKADPECPIAVQSVLDGFSGGDLHRYLLSSLSGLAPASITEILHRAFGSSTPSTLSDLAKQRLGTEIGKFFDPSEFAPCFNATDFYFKPYLSKGEFCTPTNSLNEAMDAFYSEHRTAGAFSNNMHRLQAVVQAALLRTEKKLGVLCAQYNAADNAELDRIRGELLTANLYRVTAGCRSVTLENYYANPQEELHIELDETLSPVQNAQAFFKRYQKKKKAAEMLKPQIEAHRRDAEYLEGVLVAIASAETIMDLEEIREELTGQEILKSGKQRPRKRQAEQDRLSGVKRNESDGYLILTGKNNMQNDALLKSSAPNDVWLHTKDIHGSHTVIVNPSKTLPPEAVIRRAASITALYSKANASENVPVDYTFVKFVSKPKGAAPGRVVYTNQRTIYVTPGK